MKCNIPEITKARRALNEVREEMYHSLESQALRNNDKIFMDKILDPESLGNIRNTRTSDINDAINKLEESLDTASLRDEVDVDLLRGKSRGQFLTEDNVEKALKDGKWEDVVKMISERPDYLGRAMRLTLKNLEAHNDGTKLRVVWLDPKMRNGLHKKILADMEAKGWAGQYDPNNHTVYMHNAHNSHPSELAETFTHEMVHAATAQTINEADNLINILAKDPDQWPNLTERDQQIVLAVHELDDMVVNIQAYMETPEFKKLNRSTQGAIEYATVASPHELVTMMLTDSDVATALKDIPLNEFHTQSLTPERLSIWQNITNKLKKILGAEGIEENAALQYVFQRAELLTDHGYTPASEVEIKNLDILTDLRNAVNEADPKKQQAVLTKVDKMLDYMEMQVETAVHFADEGTVDPVQFKKELDDMRAVKAQIDTLLAPENAAKGNNVPDSWNTFSDTFIESMGDDLAAVVNLYNSTGSKIAQESLGGFTGSVSSRYIQSQVPLAQWAAMNLMEAPMGFGGTVNRKPTAPIVAETWFRQHVAQIDKAWYDMVKAEIDEKGSQWSMLEKAIVSKSNPKTHKTSKKLGQQVIKEMNARQMGKDIQSSAHVKAYADKLTEMNSKLYDLQLEYGIDGITGNNKMNHYVSQVWDNRALRTMAQQFGEATIDKLFYTGLRSRMPSLSEDAAMQAAQVMRKKRMDMTSPMDEADSMSFADVMEELGKSNDQRHKDIIAELKEALKDSDNGGPGYANQRRMHLDVGVEVYSPIGTKVRLIDLLDPDVTSAANKYAKEATGRSALSYTSEGMIKSDKDLDKLMFAIAKQAEERGTFVNTRDLKQVTSHITGAPLKGALSTNARMIRDAVALSGMNGIMESQLAEAGLALVRGNSALMAMSMLKNRMLNKSGLNGKFGINMTPEQMADSNFMDDMMEMTGLYSDFENFSRKNVHYDETKSDGEVSIMDNVIDFMTGGKYRALMQHAQGKYTGYNAVRTMEEQVAMAGFMQDAVKKHMGRGSFTSDARWKDSGMQRNDGKFIFEKYLKDGTIQIDAKGRIIKLNTDKWDKKDYIDLGSALHRHAAQQIQKGFAGEMSPWMSRPDVAFLMQFRSYPILSSEKQLGRHIAMGGDKEAAVSLTLNMISSAMARYLRYSSLALAMPEDKRDAYISKKMDQDLMYDTVLYGGIPGIFMHNIDTMDKLFSRGDTVQQIPAVRWAAKVAEAMTAVPNVVTGDTTARDLRNIQGAAPLGTIGLMNAITQPMHEVVLDDGSTIRTEQNNRSE